MVQTLEASDQEHYELSSRQTLFTTNERGNDLSGRNVLQGLKNGEGKAPITATARQKGKETPKPL